MGHFIEQVFYTFNTNVWLYTCICPSSYKICWFLFISFWIFLLWSCTCNFLNVQTNLCFLIFSVCFYTKFSNLCLTKLCVEFWTKLLRNALNLINMFHYKILNFFLYAMYIELYSHIDWFGFCRFLYHCVNKNIVIYCKPYSIAWLIDIIF